VLALELPVLEVLVPEEPVLENSGAILIQDVPIHAKAVVIDAPLGDCGWRFGWAMWLEARL
jgi:hypothetical protein